MNLNEKRRIEKLLSKKISDKAHSIKLPRPQFEDHHDSRIDTQTRKIEAAIAKLRELGVEISYVHNRENRVVYILSDDHPLVTANRAKTKKVIDTIETLREQLVLDLYVNDEDAKAIVAKFIKALEELT